jgi:hypothetical protein
MTRYPWLDPAHTIIEGLPFWPLPSDRPFSWTIFNIRSFHRWPTVTFRLPVAVHLSKSTSPTPRHVSLAPVGFPHANSQHLYLSLNSFWYRQQQTSFNIWVGASSYSLSIVTVQEDSYTLQGKLMSSWTFFHSTLSRANKEGFFLRSRPFTEPVHLTRYFAIGTETKINSDCFTIIWFNCFALVFPRSLGEKGRILWVVTTPRNGYSDVVARRWREPLLDCFHSLTLEPVAREKLLSHFWNRC